jgi:hypothetical protein
MKMARHIHPMAVEALVQGLNSPQLQWNYTGLYSTPTERGGQS